MNNARRKEINRVLAKFTAIQGALEEISSDLARLRDEEEEYKEAIPESLRDSDRYHAADSAVDKLTEAQEYIQEAIDYVPDCIEAAAE